MINPSILGYLQGSTADQLRRTCGCSLDQAIEVVKATKGSLISMAMYATLRNGEANHEEAKAFVERKSVNHEESTDTKLIHLLACVGEECGEVQQAVGKSLRFGIQDCHPITGEQNWPSVVQEVHDVVAVYEMLCNHMGYSGELNQGAIRAKKAKVVKRMIQYGVIK